MLHRRCRNVAHDQQHGMQQKPQLRCRLKALWLIAQSH
jgi:hypothetical protein